MLHLYPESAVPHISLVFREMWETTNLNLFFLTFERGTWKRCGIPHLAKDERDMAHATILEREKDRMGSDHFF
jgi:hypothetical protein